MASELFCAMMFADGCCDGEKAGPAGAASLNDWLYKREKGSTVAASLGSCLGVGREEVLTGAASLKSCVSVEREKGPASAVSFGGYLSVERVEVLTGVASHDSCLIVK